MSDTDALRILRLPDVIEMTGLSRSSIYAAMGEGWFPAALRLGPRAVGWRYSDVVGWVKSRPIATEDNGS